MNKDKKTNSMIGVYDFSYAPIALGDCITWQMNILVEAQEHKLENIEYYLLLDNCECRNPLQPFLNKENYKSHILQLMPAFLCNSDLGAIRFFNQRNCFNVFLAHHVLSRGKMWPTFAQHLRSKLDFISHKKINRFFHQHKYIPLLNAPLGYESFYSSFYQKNFPGKIVVSLNIRQSALSSIPRNTFRDSPVEEWVKFVRKVHQLHPEVIFCILGGYDEIDYSLERMPNVFVMRGNNYHLAHELCVLKNSDFFMGSSSGFATMATFCGVPYLICNIQKLVAPYWEMEAGDHHYPFATPQQFLHWDRETSEVLYDYFLKLLKFKKESKEVVHGI